MAEADWKTKDQRGDRVVKGSPVNFKLGIFPSLPLFSHPLQASFLFLGLLYCLLVDIPFLLLSP